MWWQGQGYWVKVKVVYNIPALDAAPWAPGAHPSQAVRPAISASLQGPLSKSQEACVVHPAVLRPPCRALKRPSIPPRRLGACVCPCSVSTGLLAPPSGGRSPELHKAQRGCGATGAHSGLRGPERAWGCTVGIGAKRVCGGTQRVWGSEGVGHRVLTAMTGGAASLPLLTLV